MASVCFLVRWILSATLPASSAFVMYPASPKEDIQPDALPSPRLTTGTKGDPLRPQQKSTGMTVFSFMSVLFGPSLGVVQYEVFLRPGCSVLRLPVPASASCSLMASARADCRPDIDSDMASSVTGPSVERFASSGSSRCSTSSVMARMLRPILRVVTSTLMILVSIS